MNIMGEQDLEDLKGRLEKEEKLLDEAKHRFQVNRRKRRSEAIEGMIEETQRLWEEEDEESVDNKNSLASLIKGEEQEYIPVIIKAGTAGALETVLKEANKVLGMSQEV